jgi:GTP-binding protein
MKVAIIGRPNVGKSTLFNAFTKTRNALVHDRPGVTRDVVAGTRDGVEFLDTAGLEKTDELGATELALAAARAADAILFVVDAKAGLHPMDLEWAKRIRKLAMSNEQLAITLLANKSDTKAAAENIHDFYKLGFGEPIPVSAEHNIGLNEIFADLQSQATDCSLLDAHCSFKVAVMGVPNVGKSTLINRLAGGRRVLVADRPGITRDAIHIDAHYLGRDIEIIDTAGLRKKTRVSDDVETLAALKALDAMSGADAAILVLDATTPVESQSVKIAERIFDAGKILVVAMNKWDLVPDKEDRLLQLKHEFARAFSQIIKPVVLPISAERGTGVQNMMKRLYALWDASNTRAPTSFVNRVVEKLVSAKQPPMSRLKRPMKIKFASQTGTHPAVITINVGGASDIPDAYTRYLRRGISEAMGWESLPVSIEYKTNENPFDN